MDDALPPDSKLTASKRRWASEHKFLTGREGRPATDRLPPGQHLTDGWPILDLGKQPDVPIARWQLEVAGLVDHPVTLDWAAFMALPQSQVRTDIHCVTTWSRYDNDWTGVATRDLLDLVMPQDKAGYLMLHGYDGYTTNVPLADFAALDAMLVHSWQGKPLPREHGGPVRLVIPHLYFWKSAKWLSGIEFREGDAPGFWERNGYHMRGDPWSEERYG